MTLREQYAELLKTARRQFGQLKRYTIPSRSGYVPSFEDFYLTKDINERITKRDIKDLQRQIDFSREEAEPWRGTEEEEEDARTAIENLKIMLAGLQGRPKSVKGKMVAERIADIMIDMLDRAIQKYRRYVIVYDKIISWATDFMSRLEKMVLILYSKEYNGGTNNLDVVSWQSDISEFGAALGIEPSAFLMESIMSELNS